eukprot:11767528-Karenia_brevis.AAC.1
MSITAPVRLKQRAKVFANTWCGRMRAGPVLQSKGCMISESKHTPQTSGAPSTSVEPLRGREHMVPGGALLTPKRKQSISRK